MRQRGNSIIEFALSLTVQVAILAGIFQFGYSMYLYNGLAGTVANGARFASQAAFDVQGQDYVRRVKNMVVYGSPAGGTEPVVPGLNPEQVDVRWTSDAAGIPRTVTVAIRDYRVDAVFTTYRFSNKPSVTMRFAGAYKS